MSSFPIETIFKELSGNEDMYGEYDPEKIEPFHSLFKIQTKSKPYSEFFKPKRLQIDYYNKRTHRDLILKARQLGFTTQIKMDDLDYFLRFPDSNTLTVADTLKHAGEIFRKVVYAFESLPEELRNKYKLDLSSTSQLRSTVTNAMTQVATSGRSGTIHRLHVSEFAHMRSEQKQEVMLGSLQAVPDDGYAVIETTAKGLDEFYELWMDAVAGKNEWTPHFYNWTWEDAYRTTPPSGVSHWKHEYRELAKKYGLISDIQTRLGIDDSQFYWYFLRARSMKEEVKQEFPCIPEEAFLSTANGVFNMYSLQQLEGLDPIDYLYDGDLLIWKEPEVGHDYIVGVDTSEGDINSDFCVGAVLDVKTGEQVAELHGRWRDDIFAGKLAKLGMWYNMAMLAVERNNHGHSIINSLESTEVYPNMYVHEDEKTGFLTNAKTKPLLLTSSEGLAVALDDELMIINSKGFLDEARVFEYKKNKSTLYKGMGAQDGKYDDRVMAWAIAWYCRQQAMVPRDKNGNRLMVG